ncbi:hypothetical protein [Fodinicola acaciae]|uniref:hypothetical protein n=1 Tax=Fodinicola acaciae TaxID=2681555 RepID=UPI0013D62B5F|nr:hypothetical protein [Fodinicola acaciae]
MCGLGDTKTSFRASLVGYWGVGVPAILLCAYALGWHAAGVWIGLTCGFGATAVQVLIHFIRADTHRRNQPSRQTNTGLPHSRTT